MKFRHVLTAAAAATVIAPAAVLAAPAAAFATDAPSASAQDNETQTKGSSESADPSGRPDGATAPDGTPEAGGQATGTGDAGQPDAGDVAKPAPGAQPDKQSGTDADSQPGPKSEPRSGPNSGSATGGSEDTGPGPSCAISPEHLQMAIQGLQSEFVAGADWSQSSITVTNASDKPMDKVRPQPYISSAEIVDAPYEELEAEFRNPVTGKWLSFEDATFDGVFTGFPVAAHSTVTLPLRIRAVDSAKPGAGYAIIEGMFSNKDGSCGLSNHRQYDFKILPPRAKPDQPGKPGKPGKPTESAKPGGGSSGGGTTPQAEQVSRVGAERDAATGQLAETGSSSALPTIALVGGVAMAVGAGAIVTVRRRRAAGGIGGAI
ncbi:LAETG motif-containing sortase-dependent surface protein [Streptomyces noursei]|uniref:LAETG motif-containing sortase-dependent surface protein n=1 Tax=Streptomyces noursei TaxID=1971 RepID=UPI0037FAE94E